jgi:hypothetical protein
MYVLWQENGWWIGWKIHRKEAKDNFYLSKVDIEAWGITAGVRVAWTRSLKNYS